MIPKNRSEALLREYAEVSNTFRLLTDIRFKLLALLPVAAAAAAAVVAGREPDASSLVFALFGLVITIGLVTYNTRNDQLYDTLVARAAAIERALGLPDGAFANRPRAWLRFGVWTVGHRTAVASVYYASSALWLFEVLDIGTSITWRGLRGQPFPSWLHMTALAATLVLVMLIAALLRLRRNQIADDLRATAARAMALAMPRRLDELVNHTAFHSCCSKLAGIPVRHVAARIDYLARLEPGAIGHYVAQGSGHWTTAQTIAAITDLAPEWLYDCGTSRRRRIKPPATPQLAAGCE